MKSRHPEEARSAVSKDARPQSKQQTELLEGVLAHQMRHADAYGLDATTRSSLIDAALDRQIRNAQWWRSHLARPAPRVADDHEITGRIQWSEREHAYTSTNRAIFDAALD